MRHGAIRCDVVRLIRMGGMWKITAGIESYIAAFDVMDLDFNTGPTVKIERDRKRNVSMFRPYRKFPI